MDELCRGPVQGEERQTLRKVLESKLPRQVYLQNISSPSPEEVSSGCRGACPNKDVLKKIRQEARSVQLHLKTNGRHLLRFVKSNRKDAAKL